jgi:predicted membrane protein
MRDPTSGMAVLPRFSKIPAVLETTPLMTLGTSGRLLVMTLKRYLGTCFGLTFILVLVTLTVFSMDEPLSVMAIVFLAFACAVMNTFVQIYPVAAATTPLAKRTSFWAYKWSNTLFLIFPACLVLIGLPLLWSNAAG